MQNKDFKDFQKYCEGYAKKWGLNGWDIYYEPKALESAYAETYLEYGDYTATVSINSELSEERKPFRDIQDTAKHEITHILIARLHGLAGYRYSTKQEITEAVEELVHKLMDIIPD